MKAYREAQPSPLSNPHAELYRDWVRFKRSLTAAQREIHRSYQYESTVLQSYRFLQGVEWNGEAQKAWREALDRVLGAGIWRVEWQGDARNPVCWVNGVMLFV